MKNKKIPSHLSVQLAPLPESSRALFLQLWLESDEAGVLPLEIKDGLIPLEKAGLLVATESKLILKGYLSSNYSNELKPDYNPHKRPLAVIEKHGFEYDQATGEILLEETDIKSVETEYSSLKQALTNKSEVLLHKEIVMPSEAKILTIIKSREFALVLACLLMLVQSFHSSHALADLTTLANPIKTIFAISTAILMDCLIIYFVANGEKASSFIFFLFCALLNVYAYHLDMDYLTYKSFFAFVPALGVPFAVHAVSSRMQIA